MGQAAASFVHDDGMAARVDRRDAVSATILSDRRDVSLLLEETAYAAGLTVQRSGPLALLDTGEAFVLGDVILVDCPDPDGEGLATLARLDMRAAASGNELVVSTSQQALDAVFGCLDQSGAQVLVQPTAAERVVAMGLALSRLPGRSVRELTGEDRVALVRLTEQVSVLAQRIEGLSSDSTRPMAGESGAAPPRAGGVSFGKRSDAVSAGKRPPCLPTARYLRGLIRRRQARARFFDAELFADPAWNMLLDLAAARVEGAQVSVSSLCIAACVPPTTALRWIGQMTEAGLFERIRDQGDKRRAFIALSEKSAAAMAAYFASLDAADHVS